MSAGHHRTKVPIRSDVYPLLPKCPHLRVRPSIVNYAGQWRAKRRNNSMIIMRKGPGWMTLNLSLSLLLGLPAILSAQTSQDYIVRYRAGASPSSRAASVRRAGARLRFNYTIIEGVAI